MLNLAKKSDLLDIAANYELITVRRSIVKHEIKNFLTHGLIYEEIFDSSALPHSLVTQTDLQMRELKVRNKEAN